MTKRIEEVAPPVTIREKVAPLTEIHWDPMTGDGVIKFWMQDLVTDKATGEHIGVEPPINDRVMVSVSLADLMQRTIKTPLGDVTGPQLALAVKILFDELYAETFA